MGCLFMGRVLAIDSADGYDMRHYIAKDITPAESFSHNFS